MTYRQAHTLSRRMRASGGAGVALTATVHRAKVHSLDRSSSYIHEQITFHGGQTGPSSLSLSAVDEDRIVTHWLGYCESNGVRVDWVSRGQRVRFIRRRPGPRHRLSTGDTDMEEGVVIYVTPTRCLIEFSRWAIRRDKPRLVSDMRTWRKLADVTTIAEVAP